MNIRRITLATALTAVLSASMAAAAGPYQIVGTTQTRPAADLVRTEYVVKVAPIRSTGSR